MSKNKESSYIKHKNPTLSEVVCELHLDIPETDIIAGELFKVFQTEFPKMRTIQEYGVQLDANNDGITPKTLPPRQRFVFESQNNIKVQFFENIFVINILKPYPGWEEVKTQLVKYWKQAKEVIKPKAVNKVGLRYINSIGWTTKTQKPSYWICKNDYIPNYVLESSRPFISQNDASISNNDRLTITLADQEKNPSALIFDIYRIHNNNAALKQFKFETVLEVMHKDIRSVFDKSQSPSLKKLLEK